MFDHFHRLILVRRSKVGSFLFGFAPFENAICNYELALIVSYDKIFQADSSAVEVGWRGKMKFIEHFSFWLLREKSKKSQENSRY